MSRKRYSLIGIRGSKKLLKVFIPQRVVEEILVNMGNAYPKESFCYLVGKNNRIHHTVWPKCTSGYDWVDPVEPPPEGTIGTVHSHLDDKHFSIPSTDDCQEEMQGTIQGIVAIWYEDGKLKSKLMFWPKIRPLEAEYV